MICILGIGAGKQWGESASPYKSSLPKDLITDLDCTATSSLCFSSVQLSPLP